MGKQYAIVSVDDHVAEAPGTWIERVPRAMRERVPQVRAIDGQPTWTLNGYSLHRLAPPRNDEESRQRLAKGSRARPGEWDPRERLKDYDMDGVDAAVLFPNFATFTGDPCAWAHDDKAVQLECLRAYNDWLLEDFCVADPRRLFPQALVPTWDRELAIGEAYRSVDRGHKGILFGAALDVFGYPPTWDAYWDPFYSAMEELDVPLVFHQPSAAMDRAIFHDPRVSLTPSIRAAANVDHVHSLIYPTVELLMSGMLERHPRLKVQLAESGASWLLYTLHQCDYAWPRYRSRGESTLSMPPSEYFRRQCSAGFWSDVITPDILEACGRDNLLWEGDYLHNVATFPDSRKVIAQSLARVNDEDIKKKLAGGNAVRLYRLD